MHVARRAPAVHHCGARSPGYESPPYRDCANETAQRLRERDCGCIRASQSSRCLHQNGAALRPDDFLLLTWREHNALLARCMASVIGPRAFIGTVPRALDVLRWLKFARLGGGTGQFRRPCPARDDQQSDCRAASLRLREP